MSGALYFYERDRLRLAVAAQNVDQLVGNHVLDSLTSGLEVLTGIEIRRMQREMLTDCSGDCQTDVGVNVDLADSALSGFTQHLFRIKEQVFPRAGSAHFAVR